MGTLSDKLGRKRLLIFGLLVFAFVYLAFAIDLLGENHKGTAVGYMGTVVGLSTLVASSVAGVLWDHVGSEAAFVYGFLGALLAVFALLLLRESRVKANMRL